MKLITEFIPLIVFFVLYKLYDIQTATIGILIATLIMLPIVYFRDKQIPTMLLVTAVMVAIFGGLTIYLDDPHFIMIKPTIINMMFASVLIGGVIIKKPLIKYIMQHAFEMEDKYWLKFSLRWGLFFIFIAVLNECIWRNFSEEFWVNFKVFGMLTLSIVFTMSQVPFLNTHAKMVTDKE